MRDGCWNCLGRESGAVSCRTQLGFVALVLVLLGLIVP